ncbi:MAG: TIGR03936 family radical SAM-associated protein [Eubacterium sp.]|nr:TIGR03936 family radical SAM-associated protein [Eubacterium sp.]
MSDPNEIKYIKIRVRFSKRGPVRYVGHLDLMRYFQKAIRRAGLDIRYSEGFSPHQVMSFASPLSLGAESEAEYFDMDMISSPSSEEGIALLNAQMAEGIEVLSYVRLPDKSKKAMSITAATDYFIAPGEEMDEVDITQGMLDDMLSRESIEVVRKTKKGEKTVDIRPLIFEAKAQDGGVFLKLSSSSAASLNVRLFLETLFSLNGMDNDPADYLVTRREVYYDRGDGVLASLESAGEVLEEPVHMQV